MSSSDGVSSSVKETAKSILEDDVVVPPGQVFVLVSVVGPEEPQKCDQFAVKIRGVFATRAEADAHIRKLQKFNNEVHIYIGDVGKWLPLPPKPDKIEDQKYSDEFLDRMMTGYAENQLEARQMFEQRKRAVMKEGLDKNLLPEERLPKPDAEQLLATMKAQAERRDAEQQSQEASSST